MRMSSMLTPIFELKKTQTRMKKVYQKTRAFFTKKNILCSNYGKKYYFLGAEEKIKKSNENLNK